MRVTLLLVSLTVASACAGDDDSVLFPTDAEADGGGRDAPRTDGRSSDAATGEHCEPGELYISPCCGGALPQCAEVPDGGMCPIGTEPGSCWDPGVGPTFGCAAGCTPPPPYCAPAGSSCQDECNGGGFVDGEGNCLCACA